MKFSNMRKLIFFIFCLIILTIITSCNSARVLIMTAPSKPKSILASPPLSALSINDWENQKPDIFKSLEQSVYGVLPKTNDVEIINRLPLDSGNYRANIEEITLMSEYLSDQNLDQPQTQTVDFKAIIITPENTTSPVPIIMLENFCPNHNVVPVDGITLPRRNYFSCDEEGFTASIFGYFFGRYITTPPIQEILDRGFAIAVIYPSDIFPDLPSAISLYEKAPDKSARWGAIGAWAWQFSVLSNYLDTTKSFSHTIAYGHSRYGKSALLAAAYDSSIDSAIAHQSGTGGASLSKNKPGETVASIKSQYPHWFTPSYSEDNAALDQHFLLALIAPRPFLLGNAKRDVWSDPEGGFRAGLGATPIYNLYGSEGLNQKKLTEFNPEADISYWIRPGTHGVVKEDWPAFLEFLEAHFK